MNMIIEHFISGEACFSGLALIVLGLLLSFFDRRMVLHFGSGGKSSPDECDNGKQHQGTGSIAQKKKSTGFSFPVIKLLVRTSILIGMIFIVSSSTPVSPFMFNVLVFSIIVLFIALQFSSKSTKAFINVDRVIILIVCMVIASKEMHYRKMPQVPRLSRNNIYVIGDSITAGIAFKGEKTWTEIVEDRYGVNVETFAVGGGTVATAIDLADNIKRDNCLIIIEIGGNDILRQVPTTPERFRKDLQTLMKKLLKQTDGKCTIVMLELPLPPFFKAYCAAQREVASQYGVYLIPKRYYASIHCNPEMTIDGLHLSNLGHSKLANIIWTSAKNAMGK